jgi:hypothetical protein
MFINPMCNWKRACSGPAYSNNTLLQEIKMGRGILLWLLGVPIPVIILLALLFR